MSQPQPDSYYTVQPGDNLSKIAGEAYGDQSLWQYIYIANTEVIGPNPNLIQPGIVLYLLACPLHTRAYPNVQACTVTSATLHIRVSPTTKSAIVANFTQGTVLNFNAVGNGEPVNGDSFWGCSPQGHFFWMGGTSRPQG